MIEIEIGIINCVNGKQIKQKRMELPYPCLDSDEEEFYAKVITKAKKITEWFDKQDTFFSIPFWGQLSTFGEDKSVLRVIEGKSLLKLFIKSIVVFDGDKKGEEHEFYVKRTVKM